MNNQRIMVDMSATLLHVGHINLLRQAKQLGTVVVALTTDEEIFKKKGYYPEISFSDRKTILEAIKYVDEVIPSKWLITEDFLIEHNCDKLLHGDDNANIIPANRMIVLPKTKGVCSQLIRYKAYENVKNTQPT